MPQNFEKTNQAIGSSPPTAYTERTVIAVTLPSKTMLHRASARSGRSSSVPEKSFKAPTAQQSSGPLPVKKFAAAYGLHPSTVWRAVRDGRLDYVMVGRRKLILPPVVQTNSPKK
jgi:hypothetical protein